MFFFSDFTAEKVNKLIYIFFKFVKKGQSFLLNSKNFCGDVDVFFFEIRNLYLFSHTQSIFSISLRSLQGLMIYFFLKFFVALVLLKSFFFRLEKHSTRIFSA